MYVTWQILIAGFIGICVGFSSICAAGAWIYKIIKGVRKPSMDVKQMLDNDNKRIKALEDQASFILRAISLLLQDDLAILEHLRTDNNTGKMAEQEQAVQKFLIER